jgi:hypothetical protein
LEIFYRFKQTLFAKMRLALLFFLSGAAVTALSKEDALESPRWDRGTVSHGGNNIGNGDGGGIKIDTEGGDIGDIGVGGCSPAACDAKVGIVDIQRGCEY